MPNGFSGGFIAMVMITRNGKCYDEIKSTLEISQKPQSVSNYGTIIQNSDLSNSNNQIGNTNSSQKIEITNELVDEALKEINENIEKYGLSSENKQELKDILEDINEKNNKKSNLVIRALKGLWGFAKEIGCGLLVAYLSGKFGL